MANHENDFTECSPANRWQHPPSFYCPISQQCMHDPVVLSDGHTYERRYIERWLQEHSTSPVSGLQLDQLAVFSNHALRNAIEEYFQQVFSAHRRAIRKTMTSPDSSAEALMSNASLLRTIDALMQCSLLMGADLSVESTLRQIMDEAKTLLGAEAASVFLVDAQNQELYSTINSSNEELRIPMSAGIAGHVATTGEAVIIHDVYQDARFSNKMDKKTNFRTRNMMCVPLKIKKGVVIGVVQVINKLRAGHVADSAVAINARLPSFGAEAIDEMSFSADDLHFLQVFAAQAATAVTSSEDYGSPSSSQSIRLLHDAEVFQDTKVAKTEYSEESSSSDVLSQLESKLCGLTQEFLDAGFDSWDLDTLMLAKITDDRPLSTLAVHIFERRGLVDHFGIDIRKMGRFFVELEKGYDSTLDGSVPYHNRAHAAAVLHAMHALLRNTDLAQLVAMSSKDTKFSEFNADGCAHLETMACLFAAAVHDYEHRGLTNDFLVKTADGRAIRYNDRNVNENHHVAAAFALLHRDDCNFLADLPRVAFARFRSLVIDMVMGTDMARSGDILKTLNDAMDRDSAMERTGFVPGSTSDATALLQMAMKCCDLGHLALPWQQHLCWVNRLEAEFFVQGDKEKDLGLPVSFLMDRNKQGPSQNQVGFFDFVVIPLFTSFCRAVPAAEPVLRAIHSNYEAWKANESTLTSSQPNDCPVSSAARASHAETPVVRSTTSSAQTENVAASRNQEKPVATVSLAGADSAPAREVHQAAESTAQAPWKRRSGRTRQRAAKFWSQVRQRTPSPTAPFALLRRHGII
eukprot:TRINITY_DN3743_c0_g2_i2.p1 TRINITY_DN3743_c0_g2~~TRINITY_DN3743_c0_g2_i2.p1  ORF type:complete len:836 (-),score=124.46 TRINITY_DN3743_c0_g2_i2:131-2542(-)